MCSQFGALAAGPFQSFNHDRDALVFARYYVKMRRRVIIKVHLNWTPIESDNSWHNQYTSA
jgi:hypothetical protein